jgi:hypothetical protein
MPMTHHQPARGRRAQQRAEDRKAAEAAGRLRRPKTQPENPKPAWKENTVDKAMHTALIAELDQRNAFVLDVMLQLAAEQDGLEMNAACGTMCGVVEERFGLDAQGAVGAAVLLALTLHRERQAGGLPGGPL